MIKALEILYIGSRHRDEMQDIVSRGAIIHDAVTVFEGIARLKRSGVGAAVVEFDELRPAPRRAFNALRSAAGNRPILVSMTTDDWELVRQHDFLHQDEVLLRPFYADELWRRGTPGGMTGVIHLHRRSFPGRPTRCARSGTPRRASTCLSSSGWYSRSVGASILLPKRQKTYRERCSGSGFGAVGGDAARRLPALFGSSRQQPGGLEPRAYLGEAARQAIRPPATSSSRNPREVDHPRSTVGGRARTYRRLAQVFDCVPRPAGPDAATEEEQLVLQKINGIVAVAMLGTAE